MLDARVIPAHRRTKKGSIAPSRRRSLQDVTAIKGSSNCQGHSRFEVSDLRNEIGPEPIVPRLSPNAPPNLGRAPSKRGLGSTSCFAPMQRFPQGADGRHPSPRGWRPFRLKAK